jgi:putative FmdB family regulatory protein
MPTYDYSCVSCDWKKSVVRGISAPDPGYKCDKCGEEMKKVFGSINVTFNGSGFYSTDK